MRRYTTLLMVAVLVAIAVSAFLNLLLGTVSIPAKDVLDILLTGNGENEVWRNIIIKSRLPQALTAIFAGAGLSVAGLLMQTVFSSFCLQR